MVIKTVIKVVFVTIIILGLLVGIYFIMANVLRIDADKKIHKESRIMIELAKEWWRLPIEQSGGGEQPFLFAGEKDKELLLENGNEYTEDKFWFGPNSKEVSESLLNYIFSNLPDNMKKNTVRNDWGFIRKSGTFTIMTNIESESELQIKSYKTGKYFPYIVDYEKDLDLTAD